MSGRAWRRWQWLLFLSGQIPIDPATGQLVQGDASIQARRVMDNLGTLLKAAGYRYVTLDLEGFCSGNLNGDLS